MKPQALESELRDNLPLEFHTLAGNHVAGVATLRRGAREVEMWIGRMEAGASSPPHCHDTEEIVHVLSGNGWATVGETSRVFAAGDTLILPSGTSHQLFAESAVEFVCAMRSGGTIRFPYGEVMDLPWRQ
jgi:quercetin dioxygenase-like cupin family protein